MKRRFTTSLVLFGLTVAVTPVLAAQDDDEWCREWDDDNRGWHCEIREITLSDRDVIIVDGCSNGGITVEGWDRNEILVRAKVHARARSDADARDLTEEVEVITSGRVIRADGPRTRRRESWAVSYQIFAPRNSNLDLRTTNGGITIEGIAGDVEFNATNGGIRLVDLAGDIRGRTTNGGLSIWLSGSEWEGQGMDVRSTNGGVTIHVPEDYSARLETGTTNGQMNVDFPVTVQGRIGRELSVELGNGGRTIRAVTTNGGVRVRRG